MSERTLGAVLGSLANSTLLSLTPSHLCLPLTSASYPQHFVTKGSLLEKCWGRPGPAFSCLPLYFPWSPPFTLSSLSPDIQDLATDQPWEVTEAGLRGSQEDNRLVL